MVRLGQTADKAVFAAIWVGVAAMTIWAGFSAIQYSLDSGFYKDYLVKWEAAHKEYSLEKPAWPVFNEGRHSDFMDELVRLMNGRGVTPPKSNTKRSYVYRLKRLTSPHENTFILMLPDRLVIYGISSRTFDRLDKFIDGSKGPAHGRFTRHDAGSGQIFGVWRM